MLLLHKAATNIVFNNQVFNALKHLLNTTKEDHDVDYQKASSYSIETTPPYALFEVGRSKKIFFN